MKLKKKKGFTLIELLAVIAILTLIMVIVTPLILKMIQTARKEAFRASAYGIVKSAEFKTERNILEGELGDFISKYENNILSEGEKLDFKGTKPKQGIVVASNGKVSLAITNGVWCARKGYNDTKITLTKYPEEDNCELEMDGLGEIIDIGITRGGDGWVRINNEGDSYYVVSTFLDNFKPGKWDISEYEYFPERIFNYNEIGAWIDNVTDESKDYYARKISTNIIDFYSKDAFIDNDNKINIYDSDNNRVDQQVNEEIIEGFNSIISYDETYDGNYQLMAISKSGYISYIEWGDEEDLIYDIEGKLNDAMIRIKDSIYFETEVIEIEEDGQPINQSIYQLMFISENGKFFYISEWDNENIGIFQEYNNEKEFKRIVYFYSIDLGSMYILIDEDDQMFEIILNENNDIQSVMLEPFEFDDPDDYYYYIESEYNDMIFAEIDNNGKLLGWNVVFEEVVVIQTIIDDIEDYYSEEELEDWAEYHDLLDLNNVTIKKVEYAGGFLSNGYFIYYIMLDENNNMWGYGCENIKGPS